MVREKEGKIQWIEPKCYLKVGFESDNGEYVAKMMSIDSLTEFIEEEFGLNEQCIKIKQNHKKIDNIETIEKCSIKKRTYKNIGDF